MAHHFITLGSFKFRSTEVVIGSPKRTVVSVANVATTQPSQAFNYVSGYWEIRISGHILGVDTRNETANAHVVRQMHNLEVEVSRSSNTLVIDWEDGGVETFSVHKNDSGVAFTFPTHAQKSSFVTFVVTLNCS